MRRILVTKHHAPTQMAVKGLDGCRGSVFLNLLKAYDRKAQLDEDDSAAEEDVLLKTKKSNQRLPKVERATFLKPFFENLQKLCKNSKEDHELMSFEPSLVPNKSYLEQILQRCPEKREFFPPQQMDRNLMCLLDPALLQSQFANKGISLLSKMAPIPTNYHYYPMPTSAKCSEQQKTSKAPVFVQLRTKATVDEWLAKIQAEQTEKEKVQRKTNEHLHVSAKKQFDRVREKTFKKKFKNEAPKSAEGHVTLLTPHFDIWLNYYKVYDSSFSLDEYKKLEKGFPEIFTWLLNECARLVEATPSEVYWQLLVIENYFTHVLYPVDRLENELEYRNIEELPPKLQQMVRRLMNDF